MNAVVTPSRNWQAYLELCLIAGQDKTRLQPLRRYGPLSVQRPFYPEQDVCHVYLLHPPGGVVGGDQLELRVDQQPASRALFTTPGATKFYHSSGEYARVKQLLNIQDNAQMVYLPQENIYFPGARVRAKTSLNVQPGSHAIIWEKHCFGRPANDEFFAEGQVISELQVHCGEQLVFTEKQRVDATEIRRTTGLRGQPVVGSLLVYSDRLNRDLLDALTAVTPLYGISGITRPTSRLLVSRYMGSSTAEVNDYFIRLLEILHPVIMQRALCRPRIWDT